MYRNMEVGKKKQRKLQRKRTSSCPRNTNVINGLHKSSRIAQQKSASPPFFFPLVFRLSLITDADPFGDLDSKSEEI